MNSFNFRNTAINLNKLFNMNKNLKAKPLVNVKLLNEARLNQVGWAQLTGGETNFLLCQTLIEQLNTYCFLSF